MGLVFRNCSSLVKVGLNIEPQYDLPKVKGIHILTLNNRGKYIRGRTAMEFERYYLDLFEMLNKCCKKIASGNYEQADSDRLFELAKKGRYPGILNELAESFGMMMVKVEAREFRLKQIIEELEETKASLKEGAGGTSEA
jgi:hypothetical protein